MQWQCMIHTGTTQQNAGYLQNVYTLTVETTFMIVIPAVLVKT